MFDTIINFTLIVFSVKQWSVMCLEPGGREGEGGSREGYKLHCPHLFDVVARLKLLPYLRSQTVAKGDTDLVLSVHWFRRLSEDIPTYLADVLDNLYVPRVMRIILHVWLIWTALAGTLAFAATPAVAGSDYANLIAKQLSREPARTNIYITWQFGW